MFGSLEPPNIPQGLPKGSDQEAIQAGKPPRSESSAGICAPLSTSPQVLSSRQWYPFVSASHSTVVDV